MRELAIDTPLGRIAGLHAGTPGAPRVLALHGWLDNAASFLPLAPFLGGIDDDFRNASVARLEQAGFNGRVGNLRYCLFEELLAGVHDGLARVIQVQCGGEGTVVHAHQGFVGNVGDIQLGAAATGDMGGFGQGAARGFAVVDGDQNVFVHGVFSCVGNSMALSYQVGIASAVREILRAACAGRNAALAAVFST